MLSLLWKIVSGTLKSYFFYYIDNQCCVGLRKNAVTLHGTECVARESVPPPAGRGSYGK